MEPIKIMLVDREEIFLEGLAEVLQQRLKSGVILRGRSVTEILETNHPLSSPDVVLMGKDVYAGSIGDCIRKTKELLPESKVALILPPEEDENPAEIIKSGALACLSRNIGIDELISCIQLISKGRIIVSQFFAEKFLKEISAEAQEDVKNKHVLSGREVEIAVLVAQGKTNREISRTLFVTENTVKAHVRNILSKLQFKNRQQLVAYTVLKNLVALGVLVLFEIIRYNVFEGIFVGSS